MPAMTITLDLYSDYVCPWCYFMTRRIERLHKEYDIATVWHPFPLHPDTPEEGRSLEEIYSRYPYPTRDMLEHLRRNARALNLPYGERTMTYNSRLAQELGCWAEAQGRGEAFHEEAFRAYFVELQNLARTPVLLGIVRQAGLDPDGAEEVLATRAYAAEVDRHWKSAREQGVKAVPTIVVGDNMLIGARQYRALADFIEEQGAQGLNV
jgi:predicted DsbA family dithiol-disulfide isomerase